MHKIMLFAEKISLGKQPLPMTLNNMEGTPVHKTPFLLAFAGTPA